MRLLQLVQLFLLLIAEEWPKALVGMLVHGFHLFSALLLSETFVLPELEHAILHLFQNRPCLILLLAGEFKSLTEKLQMLFNGGHATVSASLCLLILCRVAGAGCGLL